MNRTKYVTYYDYVSMGDLESVLYGHFSREETLEMNKKRLDVLKTLNLNDYKDVALAQKLFELGYAAAHAFYVDSEGKDENR